jgi:hypothetical protein
MSQLAEGGVGDEHDEEAPLAKKKKLVPTVHSMLNMRYAKTLPQGKACNYNYVRVTNLRSDTTARVARAPTRIYCIPGAKQHRSSSLHARTQAFPIY